MTKDEENLFPVDFQYESAMYATFCGAARELDAPNMLRLGALTTGALDNTERLREDGLSLSLEALNQVPRLVRRLIRVDGADVALGGVRNCLGQTLNLVEVCESAAKSQSSPQGSDSLI